MEIFKTVTPNFSISVNAFAYVLEDVPNPGIVTAIIFFISYCNFSNADTATSNANVESSPPETPITRVDALECFIRLNNAYS